jgi:hypothetical protein
MIFEVFQDMQDDTGKISFSGYRCLICGEILDPVIVANRQNRPAPLLNKNRKLIVSSRG